jgi:hypothetical protein
VVAEGVGDGAGDAVAVRLADVVADVVAVGVAVELPGACAVPLNSPVAVGDTVVPLAVGDLPPELVQAVIPRENTIIAMTLTARMPTQCLFPSSARGNLDNR